jgi:hypothetical protein
MIHMLRAINTANIFLEGCDFQIKMSHQQEHLKLTLDGGYSGSNEIVYFELDFRTVGCIYYENNEMWLEELAKKYDISTIEQSSYRGIFNSDTVNLEKIKTFDPFNCLNLTHFLILGQHCFCEFIAQKEFSIQKLKEQH